METEIFQCRRCGYCCHGETTVSLNDEDLARMVAYFKLDKEEVIKKYLRVTGNVVQMQVEDGHCIFYHDGCTIHQARPWRCRQWPLHPSILTDPANFSAIKDSCPGIRLSDYGRFQRKLAALIEKSKKENKG